MLSLLFYFILTGKDAALKTTSSHLGLYAEKKVFTEVADPRPERQKQILMRLFKALCGAVTESSSALYYSVI